MNAPQKKRGRPKSKDTLEKEHIDDFLSNPPEHIKMSPQEKKEQNEWVQGLEDYLKELHAEFNPAIPNRVIENLASISDESMNSHEKQILDAYYRAENKVSNGQRSGGKTIANLSRIRAQEVWGKNSDLIRRIHSGKLTINGASKKILEEWDIRGDEEVKPTIRTLSNWYKRN